MSSDQQYSNALPEKVVLESRTPPLEQIVPVENIVQDTAKPNRNV